MSIRHIHHALRDFERSFANFEEPFARSVWHRHHGTPFAVACTSGYIRPAVDFSETSKAYLIEAELPGVKREDIDIEFQDGNTIVLKGRVGEPAEAAPSAETTSLAAVESASTSETSASSPTPTQIPETTISADQPTFWGRERLFGSFRRAFTFPVSVDANSVNATLRDGVLSVKIPKLEPKVNKIQIA
ncbi:hypothetical protein HDV00_012654 [Rhizophlyctis rosea]|nr:hypothetical protein HDV00_012654 [Rhizophlyctis rosea]